MKITSSAKAMLPRTRPALRGKALGPTFWVSMILLGCTIAASAWYLYAEKRIAGPWGFSLDDSWIYASFARNIATGHGYAFNPGEKIAGATGPLYAMVLALLYAIFHDVVIPAKILGIACLGASGILTYLAARSVNPGSRIGAFLAGILVGVSPLLLWAAVSGMEIPLFILVSSLGIYFYAKKRWRIAALWWAIGVWIRPDGILLAVIGIFLWPPGVAKRRIWDALLVAAPILVAYVGFNYLVGHQFVPNSILVKSHPGRNTVRLLWEMLQQWVPIWGLRIRRVYVAPHAVVLLPCIIAGALLLARRLPALAAYPLCLPIALAVAGASSGAHARYLMPSIPFAVLLAVTGMEHLSERFSQRRPQALLLALAAVALVWQIDSVQKMGKLHGQNVENINDMQRFLAEGIRLSTSPGDTIATNDVGAIGYFSGCYVVDLAGLVSPQRPFPESIAHYRPKFVVIFPDWYRWYLHSDPNTERPVFYDEGDSTAKYVPVAGAGLYHNTICARDKMIVFARLPSDQAGPAKVQMIWH